jgi:hypothetical protein
VIDLLVFLRETASRSLNSVSQINVDTGWIEEDHTVLNGSLVQNPELPDKIFSAVGNETDADILRAFPDPC